MCIMCTDMLFWQLGKVFWNRKMGNPKNWDKPLYNESIYSPCRKEDAGTSESHRSEETMASDATIDNLI